MAEAARLDTTESPKTAAVSWSIVAVTAISIVGLIIRAAGINHESLWLDEGYTILFSRLPFPQVITVGGAHEHPPLFYLLCHIAYGLISWPLAPRLLSIAAGSATIPLVYLLGRRMLSVPAGIVGAAFMAISPVAVWYSQDGRAYALASLLVVGSYLLLIRALDVRTPDAWVLYSLCTLACLYTEYTTVFALAPQILFLARGRRALLYAWLGVGIGYLPWLIVLIPNAASVAADYWIPAPTPDTVVATSLGFLGLITPCPSPPCSGVPLPGVQALARPLVALFAAGVVAALVWSLRRRSFPRLVLLAWALFPFAAIVALAPYRSLYVDRAFLDSLPALALVLAAGLLALPRAAGPVLLVLLLAANAATSTLLFTTHSNPDWRSLARDMAAAYRPGDAVFYNPAVLRSLVGAYLPPSWHPTRERALWSRLYLDVPGWQRYYPEARKTDQKSRLHVEAILRNQQLSDVSRGERNVWLVSLDYPGLNDTRRWFITHGYQMRLSEVYDGDSRLELWSKNAPQFAGPAAVPARWSDGWKITGRGHLAGGIAYESEGATLTRTFSLHPETLYTAQILYRSAYGFPELTVDVYDKSRRLLATFPRTKWFGFAVNDVWLSEPFGFIAPPGSASARITASTKWGGVAWQTIAVYQRR